MSGFSGVRDWIGKRMKNRNGTDFIIMILIGVLVLIVAVPTGTSRQTQRAQKEEEDAQEAQAMQQTYKSCMERELTELLETMEGVGKCRVMLTVEEGSTAGPRVASAVVVAQGGGNAGVVSNISRAVMSLFQLEAHKITVVKMSVQEE